MRQTESPEGGAIFVRCGDNSDSIVSLIRYVRQSEERDRLPELEAWTREIADVRVTGRREGQVRLPSVAGMPPFHVARKLIRPVQADYTVEIDGTAYSVPWRLIGKTVRSMVVGGAVRIHHLNQEVAVHAACTGRGPAP